MDGDARKGGTILDTRKDEAVDAELDRLISRRSDRRLDPDEQEELWKASVRRHHERERRQLDAERYRWHAGQAERLRRTMTELVAFHETQAAKLLEGEA